MRRRSCSQQPWPAQLNRVRICMMESRKCANAACMGAIPKTECLLLQASTSTAKRDSYIHVYAYTHTHIHTHAQRLWGKDILDPVLVFACCNGDGKCLCVYAAFVRTNAHTHMYKDIDDLLVRTYTESSSCGFHKLVCACMYAQTQTQEIF